eukprot:gene142-22_t
MAGLMRQKAHPSSAGMMGGAFFVGRGELITWVNETLLINMQKIEQCASGAIYCQILDACHPNQVQMKKVNWMAKVDHEYIPNFKLLQAAFDRLHISRNIDVDKLIRGKYQDNLEFLQWMKCYYDSTWGGQEYDPIERRDGRPQPDWCLSTAQPAERQPRSAAAAAAAPAQKQRPRPGMNTREGGSRTQQLPGPGDAGQLSAENRNLKHELQEMRTTVDGLETERDYYFQKLREIEILTQTAESDAAASMTVPGLLQKVQEILYKENQENPEDEEAA